jgi:hypothetical protein
LSLANIDPEATFSTVLLYCAVFIVVKPLLDYCLIKSRTCISGTKEIYILNVIHVAKFLSSRFMLFIQYFIILLKFSEIIVITIME